MDQLKKPTSSRPAWQDQAFEFEIVDLDDARRTLDIESLSQFDTATVVPPEYWHRVRRRALPTDRALTGRAIDWLMSLPPSLRLHSLSSEFPRIANALADVSDQPVEFDAVLERLLCDGRKGRKGFPAAVRDELVALQAWTQSF